MGAVEGREGVPGFVQGVLRLAVPPGPWRHPGGPGAFWKEGHRRGETPLVVREAVGTLTHRLIRWLSAGWGHPQGHILETVGIFLKTFLYWSIANSQVALAVKNPPTNAEDIRDEGSTSGSGRSPGGGHGNPL